MEIVDRALRSLMTVPYATLLFSKMVEEDVRGQYVRVDWHFFQLCMQEIVEGIMFDEEWYLGRYPDVMQAIQSGTVANAAAHYQKHGYFENRLPYRIQVDTAWYLRQYPDVQAAIERDQLRSAQRHFEMVGYSEGRLPYPNFTLAMAVKAGDGEITDPSYLNAE
jgi:hypothetical protein